MKKVIKYFAGLLVLLVLVIGLYLYKLHALAVEGNEIFTFRCTKVNLPLIAYKNSFLKVTDALKNPDKYPADEVEVYFDDYILGMRSYVIEESKWLETQKEYMNRWDFELIEPWYMKQAAEYQWKMYEGYRDDAKYLLEIYDAGGWTVEINAKFQEARNRRDEYEQKYYKFFDEASAIRDWRKYFSIVSVPKECTDEVLTIPNTSGAIDWEGAETTPSPTIFSIDPESTT